MNAALVSLLNKFMSDGDAKKAKEDDRKYRESLIQKDWERDDTKTAEERAYRESIAKQNRELTKQEKAAEELRKLKQTTLDNVWLESNYPKSAADVNAHTLELIPDVSKQLMEDARRREVAVRDFENTRPFIAPAFQGTNQQGALIYPSLEGAAAARTGAGIADIAQGVPERQAVNQRLSLALGGQSPSEAFSKEYFPTVDLSGKTTMQRNPYYDRMNPDPMAGMVGGNNVLKSVAEQLGLPQYPMEFGPDGVPVQRKKPATATPSTQRQPVTVDSASASSFTGEPITIFEGAPRLLETAGDVALNVIDGTRPALTKWKNQNLGNIYGAISPFYKKPLIEHETWKAQGGEQAQLRAITEGERARQLREVGGNVVINPLTGYPYTEEEAREPITNPNLKAYRRAIGR